MSPGLYEEPEGRFSVSAAIPTRLTPRRRSAAARTVPIAVAAPIMSHFMSPIFSAGLIEIPPESNVTPFPTSATGASPFRPPRYSRTTTRGSSAAPRLTARRPPILSFRIAFLSRTVAFTPRAFASFRTRSAKSRGSMSFDGVLPRSRTRRATRATARASATSRASTPANAPRGCTAIAASGVFSDVFRLVARKAVVGEEERAQEELPRLFRVHPLEPERKVEDGRRLAAPVQGLRGDPQQAARLAWRDLGLLARAKNVEARRLPPLPERKREERAVRRRRGGPGGGDTGAQVGGKRREGFLPSACRPRRR